MARKIDLAGRKFGRLMVLYDTGERKNGKVIWHCKCDCGNEVDVKSVNLISGYTTSCGCYNRERVAEANTVHGMSRRRKYHPVYRIWQAILQRCENPDHNQYKNYGGRGIKVCDEWHDAVIFINWALTHGWQEGLSIDRIDNDKGYSPDNCRWVTQKEQQRNRRNNHLIAFDGKTQTVVQWAEEMNISPQTLYSRINQCHWPIERALTEPIRRHKHAS